MRVRAEFQKVYDCLQVRLIERGESFYQDMMKAVVEELKQKGKKYYYYTSIILIPCTQAHALTRVSRKLE